MQLPIFRSRTYIRFTNLDSSLGELENNYSDLNKLTTYTVSEDITIGKWIDGSNIKRKVYHFNSVIKIPSTSWYATPIPKSGIKCILNANTISEVGALFPVMAQIDQYNYVGLECCRASGTSNCEYLILEYVEST